jgi:uncharacterized ubiquitin-like protein YukD
MVTGGSRFDSLEVEQCGVKRYRLWFWKKLWIYNLEPQKISQKILEKSYLSLLNKGVLLVYNLILVA